MSADTKPSEARSRGCATGPPSAGLLLGHIGGVLTEPLSWGYPPASLGAERTGTEQSPRSWAASVPGDPKAPENFLLSSLLLCQQPQLKLTL